MASLVALAGALGLARAVIPRLSRTDAGPTPTAAAQVTKARPSVAVLGFKNLTGRSDAAWDYAGKGFGEAVATADCARSPARMSAA